MSRTRTTVCGLPAGLCVRIFAGALVLNAVFGPACSVVQEADIDSPKHNNGNSPDNVKDNIQKLDASMPGTSPTEDENYLCTTIPIKHDPSYILKFEPTADAARVHHLLMFGCIEGYKEPGKVWDCLRHPICKEGASDIIYAWARNAPALDFPEGVGRPLGREYGISHVVLQIHYAKKFRGNVMDNSGVTLHTTTVMPPHLSGIYLFVSSDGPIPAGDPDYRMNMSCLYKPRNRDASIIPFAYRTHAHALGVVISAFRNRHGKWKMIGKGNPQWPQMFYPVKSKEPIVIEKNDKLFAQCLYNASSRTTDTYIGAHGANEMCNFYMYYYTDASLYKSLFGCSMNRYRKMFAKYPAEGSTPMPPNPELDHHGHQSFVPFGVTEVPNWPAKLSFGQIGGLTVDCSGNIVVFHRGSRKWTAVDFDQFHKYLHVQDGPIMEDTVFILDPVNGTIVRRWGAHMFYVPHGIFVDHEDNIWVTDVALHQVFKFKLPDSNEKENIPLLELGHQFEPGYDEKHFCKPAAVSIALDGTIYVADGYCNYRIIAFTPDGTVKGQWGSQSTGILADGYPPLGTFSIPHDLSIDNDRQLIYIADRMNARMQTMHFNGTFLSQVHHRSFGATLYALSYSKPADTIYAVNGPDMETGRTYELRMFAISPKTGKLLYSWGPTSMAFEKPHAMTVGKDGRFVYTGELTGRLWKFNNSMAGGFQNLPTEMHDHRHINHHTDAAMKESQNGSWSIGKHNGHGRPQIITLGHIFAELTKSSGSANSAASTKGGNGSRKPGMAGDSGIIRIIHTESTAQLILIISAAVAIPLLLIILVCLCIRFRKQGGFRRMNMSLNSSYRRSGGKGSNKENGRVPLLNGMAWSNRSHKGFQPLNTEDIDAVDDITDESDNEDTIYPLRKNHNPDPLRA